MDVFAHLALGFSVAFSASNLLYCLVGVLLGTAIGVLPGVGPLVTIALLLPLTYGLTPDGSIIMLAGIYYGAAYGGSTTAILLNLPGETSSAVTCIDGYQMARQGRAGAALAIAVIGSLAGGCVGTLLIAMLGPQIASLALDFGPASYFSLVFLGLMCSAVFSSETVWKGLGTSVAGIIFGLSGIDVISGASRLTFGIPGLADGIDFVVVAMGLFAISEIVTYLGNPEARDGGIARISRLMPSKADLIASWKPIVRGTAIGSFFGALPGTGQTISSFCAYMLEKKISKTPERFGKGAVEGVAAPETANNAAAQTAFIPTLTLGIPGSGTMALMIGALTIHGINPGPQIMNEHPDLFWGLIASMWIGNVLLVIVNLPLVGIWVSMLKVPYNWLCSFILIFGCIGIFSVNGNWMDVAMAVFFGLLGYVFVKLDCSLAPFILGFILGPLLEENFRRAMLISRGDPSVFIREPISAVFLLAALAIGIMMVVAGVRKRRESISALG